MKAKWCKVCDKLVSHKYKRCPKCLSFTIIDAAQWILLLQKKLRSRREE